MALTLTLPKGADFSERILWIRLFHKRNIRRLFIPDSSSRTIISESRTPPTYNSSASRQRLQIGCPAGSPRRNAFFIPDRTSASERTSRLLQEIPYGVWFRALHVSPSRFPAISPLFNLHRSAPRHSQSSALQFPNLLTLFPPISPLVPPPCLSSSPFNSSRNVFASLPVKYDPAFSIYGQNSFCPSSAAQDRCAFLRRSAAVICS